jgi:hypothetical protein
MKRSIRTLFSSSSSHSTTTTTTTTTFHDSQSGLLLSKPNRDLLRIHEINLLNTYGETNSFPSFSSPSKQSHLSTISYEIKTISEAISHATNNSTIITSSPRKYSTCITSHKELDALINYSNINSKTNLLKLQNCFSLSLSTYINSSSSSSSSSSLSSFQNALSIIKKANENNFLTRVTIMNAWIEGLDKLEDAVARLADIGASVITVSSFNSDDSDSSIYSIKELKKEYIPDDDEIREAIERVFNLDVAGDAMIERFSAQLNKNSVLIALQSGITRLVARSSSNHSDKDETKSLVQTSDLIQIAHNYGRRLVLQ